ncbi:component of spliceosome involved in mRNA splicing, putative [Candida dubliniensis CD36]|uniref:Splicing factor YJU2 n=1 Tax=Candida dubliniensis (strain CD36 / ATCC MYA-646 / CBS 7987 / NCPF 3949 / NRRL Y-17841) TaxID=573826 RepID=B9WCZ3_CANDC|nr:component of spliceosome involved in mRNA splicing, putative [Candida dubliniensis CD36]CAX42542.1 component of spliceosome involved in mRNA splicing, putative [Candida dubliniensis CD36]
MYSRYQKKKKEKFVDKKKKKKVFSSSSMSERKAINKWYPPDYDPSKVPKRKKNASSTIKIRMMAPYSMRCLKCDEYIGARRSFNARKEITNEKYLNIKIIRFYISCPGCNNTITFKTDPKNAGYTPEEGAVRNYEKTTKKESEDDLLARLEKEEQEDKKYQLLKSKRKNNPFWNEQTVGMENLEKRLQEQHKQQLLNEQLEAIQTKASIDKDKLEEKAREKLQVKINRPTTKHRLPIPTTIKLPKKPKLVNYSSDSD